MGNQPSRDKAPTPTGSSPQSPTKHNTPPVPTHHAAQHAPQYNPRRRVSIQALSIKANTLPPTTSLASATINPASTHPSSRGRARTVTADQFPDSISSTISTTSTLTTVATQLRATHDSFRPLLEDKEQMGNEQSRQKGRDQARASPPSAPAPKPLPAETSKPSPPSPPSPPSQPSPPSPPSPPKTRPVDVPAGPREEQKTAPTSSLEPADASLQDYFAPSSQFSRPPRLPLPIEEEVHTPGSPILSPTDFVSPIFPNEAEGVLPRRASVLSSTTADDDDLGEEFKAPQGQPTVPTLIEWESPGDRVFVTGTFAGWNRKYKLHRNGPSKKKDVLSAMVNIVPGTHHLKFIVDGDMTTSDKLPTAVDYTNILVNYLEVSIDDIPQSGTGVAVEPNKSDSTPVQDLCAPEGIFPPQMLPPSPELEPVKVLVPEIPKPKNTLVPSPRKYHGTIPRYLLDLDAPENSSRMARANAVASQLPTPPSLPMFLSKSILNGITPMKDDSSVLIMPNHTVLNHLATSSIKNNILATSGTTRYKQKFLTTIMYKPKNEDAGEH